MTRNRWPPTPSDASEVSKNVFDINSGEILVLAILAVIVLGPERLPAYAQKAREWLRQVRLVLSSARGQMQQQFGSDFDSIDLQKLNPRQYDPRSIVREALLSESDASILGDLDPDQFDLRGLVRDAFRDDRDGDMVKDPDVQDDGLPSKGALLDASACGRRNNGGHVQEGKDNTPLPDAQDASYHDDDGSDEIDWQRFEEAKALNPSRAEDALPDDGLDNVEWLKFDEEGPTAASTDEGGPPESSNTSSRVPQRRAEL